MMLNALTKVSYGIIRANYATQIKAKKAKANPKKKK